jgi:peptide chain release factor 3
LQTEYGAESRLEPSNWKILRWASTEDGCPIDEAQLPTGARLASDTVGKTIILFQDQWSCDFYAQRNPKVRLSALPEEGEPTEVLT